MRILFFMILITCFTGNVVCISKHKFGECLPVSLLSIPLILYFSEFIFGTFSIGYLLICLIAVAFVPIAIYLKCVDKFDVGKICSAGFWAFIMLVLFFCIMDFRRYFWEWDELSHWGVMTKELLRLDGFYTAEESRLLVHKDYPPFVSLFEMFFCKVMGGYSDSRMYLAIHILSSALIIPPVMDIADIRIECKKKEIRKFLKSFVEIGCIILLFLLCVSSLDSRGYWNSAYKDVVLACMAAYAMFWIASKRALQDLFGLIALAISTTAILLTKQMGILYLLLIWFYYAVSFWIDHTSVQKESIWQKAVRLGRKLIFLLAVPLSCQYIWKRHLQKLEIGGGQFDLSKINVTEILAMLSDTEAVIVRRQTFNNFFMAVKQNNIGNTVITLSYLSCFAILLVALYFLYKKGSSILNRNDTLVLGVTVICGIVGYAFTMCILYLFCYSEVEMLNLASYERYMSSFVLSKFILFYMIWIYVLSDRKMLNMQKLLLGMAICIIGVNLNNLTPGFFTARQYAYERELAGNLDAKVGDKGTIFILSRYKVQMQYYVNYFADEAKIVLCYDDIMNMDFEDAEEKTRIENAIFSNDYLYVCDITKKFNRAFSWRNNNEDFELGVLYEIHEDGTVSAVQ